MLFRKNIARSCTYCKFGTRLDEFNILCAKKGMVSSEHSCRKFAYDPCKRVPPKVKASDFSKYDQEDYSL